MNRDQLESKVVKVPFCGCWIWMGGMKLEYGSAWHEGRTWSAHRVAYELYKGHIPEELQVRHTCDVKLCVNPDHLVAGTGSENMMDYINRRPAGTVRMHRGPAKNPHMFCKYGHKFTPENTMIKAGGGVNCRTCNKDRIWAWKRGMTLEEYYSIQGRLIGE